MTDAVDKVGDEQRAGNNRIQGPSCLNLYGAPDAYLESMLLTRASKNVYRQHRPILDIKGPASGVTSYGVSYRDRPLFALAVALLIRADEFCIGEHMAFHR
jgi:hypothetical protein